MSDWRSRVLRPAKRVNLATIGRRREPSPEESMDPRGPHIAIPPEGRVVDAAVYRQGRRTDSPSTPADTLSCLREQPDAMGWIGLYQPDEAQLAALDQEFGLHELAVEDAVVAHQRPKLERYGDTLFVVLRAARYDDAAEEVEFGEILYRFKIHRVGLELRVLGDGYAAR